MELPFELNKKIVDFLTSIPNIDDNKGQRAFVYSAGLDTQLKNQISFAATPGQFAQLLVSTLINYGKLEDGRDALEAILQTAENFVGSQRREYCESLIQQLRAVSNVEEHSPSSPTFLSVQLLLEGNIQDFNETERQNLKKVIAAILDIERSSVRILHIIPTTSFHVIVELPGDSALELVALFTAKDKRVIPLLHQFSVKSINIAEGEELDQLSAHQLNLPKKKQFMDNELRNKLIRLLCSYSPLTTRAGRDTWLMNLPSNVRDLIIRRDEHCKIDLAFIIDTLQYQQLADGRWPLLILLEAVLSETEGLVLGQQIASLKQKIQERLQPLEVPSDDIGDFDIGLDTQPEFEEIIIGEDEKVPISFLENGVKAAKAVARIMVPRTIGGQGLGTGWLIAPNLLLTCDHVIRARTKKDPPTTQKEMEQQAKASILWFGYDVGAYTEYRCIELVCADEILDYALLRIAEKSVDDVPLSDWGILKVVKIQPNLIRGTRLNVIQHPEGRVKEVALRTNFYIGSVEEKSRLHYLSDTEGGSSGSPVMDDNWQVVALHRAWDDYNRYYKKQPIRFNSLGLQYSAPNKSPDQFVASVNEGVLIHTILKDLPELEKREIKYAQGWS